MSLSCIFFGVMQKLSLPPFDDLKVGETVGLYVSKDGDLHFLVNGCDTGAAFHNLPTNVPLFVVVDVYGKAQQVSIVG